MTDRLQELLEKHANDLSQQIGLGVQAVRDSEVNGRLVVHSPTGVCLGHIGLYGVDDIINGERDVYWWGAKGSLSDLWDHLCTL